MLSFSNLFTQWLSNQRSLTELQFCHCPATRPPCCCQTHYRTVLPQGLCTWCSSAPITLLPLDTCMACFLTSSGLCLDVKWEASDHSTQNAVPLALSIPLSHSSVFRAPCGTPHALPALLSVSTVFQFPHYDILGHRSILTQSRWGCTIPGILAGMAREDMCLSPTLVLKPCQLLATEIQSTMSTEVLAGPCIHANHCQASFCL